MKGRGILSKALQVWRDEVLLAVFFSVCAQEIPAVSVSPMPGVLHLGILFKGSPRATLMVCTLLGDKERFNSFQAMVKVYQSLWTLPGFFGQNIGRIWRSRRFVVQISCVIHWKTSSRDLYTFNMH